MTPKQQALEMARSFKTCVLTSHDSIDKMIKVLEPLLADKARLDWLNENLPQASIGTPSNHKDNWHIFRLDEEDDVEGATLRTAIDKAIRGEG